MGIKWEFASDEMALQKYPRNIVTSTFVEKVGTSAGSSPGWNGSIGLIMVSTFCHFPCQFPMVKSWWNHVKSNIWCFCYFLMSLFFCCWTYLSHLCQTIKPLKNYHQLSVRNMSGNGAVYDTVSISSYNFDVWLWNFMRIRPLQEVTTLKTCHETQSRLVTLG